MQTDYSGVVPATYIRDQKQDRYRGNPLIEALPRPLTDEEMLQALSFLPEFNPESRQWEDSERLRELSSLSNLMVPLSSHVQLGHALDSMMREGYVGRAPMTSAHISIYQEIHRDSQARGSSGGSSVDGFRQSHGTLSPQLSQALVNVSGMGKTTTVRRVCARYPQVIYHQDIDLYQITWLHFEMPSDGGGVKALLISIIEAISELVPDNTYYEDYVVRARPSEAALQSSVRRLLNKHCVGLLIPDEVQNAANGRKSNQVVMTELTTLANKSRAPILYIGTPKAHQVLGLDLRQARRAMNLTLGNWNPLPRHNLSHDNSGAPMQEPGEWVDFISVLWRYCWVRNPVPLTERLLDVIYDCTQGIIDLAIKLLVVAQSKAILDGTETLTEQLLREAYQQHFEMLHPMLDAYRRKDFAALARYDDLKLPMLDTLLDGSRLQARSARNQAVSTFPSESSFVPRLATAGEAIGLPAEDALAIAQAVATEGTAKNLLDGVAQMADRLKAPKKRKTAGSRSSNSEASPAPEAEYRDLDKRPDDLRNAIVMARSKGSDIPSQMVALKLLRPVEDFLCLD